VNELDWKPDAIFGIDSDFYWVTMRVKIIFSLSRLH